MKIYLIYTASRSVLSRTIKLYTKEDYNHVSIAFDKSLTETYSFGRKKISNPFIGGFVKEDFNDPFFLTAHCEIYSITLTTEQYLLLRQQLAYFINNQPLLRYNLLGLLAITANVKFHRENAFFCSEFVATLLTKSRIASFSKELVFVTPQDILRTCSLEREYHGTVKGYLAYTAIKRSKTR